MNLLLLMVFLLLAAPLLMMLLFGMVVLQSAGAVLTIPRQLWEIGRDRRTRRNHALEHATVNVLEERFGPQKIAGAARPDGFALFNVPFSPEVVMDAAVEGWRRLSRGERRLAIHPRCGTSMAASTLLVSAAFLGALFFGKALSAGSVAAVFVLAALLSKPVGLWVQRFITASSDVEGTTVEAVLPSTPPFVLIFGLLAAGRVPVQNYLVRTRATEHVEICVRRVGEPGEGFRSAPPPQFR